MHFFNKIAKKKKKKKKKKRLKKTFLLDLERKKEDN